MGVQTMSCHGGGGSGGAGGGTLSRQGSVYSLTLNEVESHLGEPLRSMNLDDLLRTVLPAAEPHAAATTGKKTVDEVWRDIQSASSGRHGAPAMGEMTLEDFLSRAGVAVDGADAGVHWLRQCQPPLQYVGRPVPRPLAVGTGPVLDAVYRDSHGGGGIAGFLSQVAGRKRGAAAGDGVVEKTVERRQKRMIKNRESAARSRARKQVKFHQICRIKMRPLLICSAAMSQAYTNELENKISRLEEENEHLREQLKKLEPVVQFMPQKLDAVVQFVPQKLESLVQFVPQPEAKQQLRRINSASF
ncbi:hypothetical protein GUJ93_ZPchr0013g37054 [Zizania palustris]|uniref:BZIP domain-containing protein n=1 Tax=Zizania palustris TaxID=103762 RepID=A0A8J5WXH8_ZIZPA|nr:hypothetical protein GUJ93_ZPchr0013g37054 [Zizania palustris]